MPTQMTAGPALRHAHPVPGDAPLGRSVSTLANVTPVPGRSHVESSGDQTAWPATIAVLRGRRGRTPSGRRCDERCPEVEPAGRLNGVGLALVLGQLVHHGEDGREVAGRGGADRRAECVAALAWRTMTPEEALAARHALPRPRRTTGLQRAKAFSRALQVGAQHRPGRTGGAGRRPARSPSSTASATHRRGSSPRRSPAISVVPREARGRDAVSRSRRRAPRTAPRCSGDCHSHSTLERRRRRDRGRWPRTAIDLGHEYMVPHRPLAAASPSPTV